LLGTISGRQRAIVFSLHIIKANYPRTVCAFEMRMLMRTYIGICMKTPYPVVTHNPMDIAICVQPFKYPIERYTIQPVYTLETLFNLMMADRMSLPEKHGENLHPAGGYPIPAVSDRLFRLFLQVDKHKNFALLNYCTRIATQLRLL
jgi:hypothetical protein